MAQTHSMQVAMFDPLRQLLFITLFAMPLLALANPPTAANELTFGAAAKVKSDQERQWAILAFEGGHADLLLQHTPRGHAWGFQALSTIDDPAPRSFDESVVEVSEPSDTVTPISPVPEPASYALTLAGLAAVVYIIRRRRQE